MQIQVLQCRAPCLNTVSTSNMKWAFVIAFVLSMAAGPGWACSPPMFWQPRSFMERLASAPIAFRGKVADLIPYSNHPWSNLYEAGFDVDCVYKGIGTVSKTVTVSGFGFDGGMCTATNVAEGVSYVIFADSYSDGDLSVYDVNMQSAATQTTPFLIEDLEKEYNCADPQ